MKRRVDKFGVVDSLFAGNRRAASMLSLRQRGVSYWFVFYRVVFFFCREFSLEWIKVAPSFEFRRSLPLERDVYFSPVSLYIRQVFAVNREVILSYSGWQVCDWIIKSDFWGKRIECTERRRSIRTSLDEKFSILSGKGKKKNIVLKGRLWSVILLLLLYSRNKLWKLCKL